MLKRCNILYKRQRFLVSALSVSANSSFFNRWDLLWGIQKFAPRLEGTVLGLGRYSAFGLHHLLHKYGFEIVELHKTTHFAEVRTQLSMLRLHGILRTINQYLNIGINLILIAPFTALGLLFPPLLPKNRSRYLNSVVFARQIHGKS